MRINFSRIITISAITPMAPVALSFITASLFSLSFAAWPDDFIASPSKVSASPSRSKPLLLRIRHTIARAAAMSAGHIFIIKKDGTAVINPWKAPTRGKKTTEPATSFSVTWPRTLTGTTVRN